MAELGCGTNAYSITDRDGRTVATRGLLTGIEYNRVLNDVSSASAVIGITGADCCDQLKDIRAWRYMLNCFRNGEFMWSGLIVNIEWTREEVSVQAVDIVGLLDRRVPHQNFNFTSTDLTVIAQTLIDDGFAPDDPGHTVTILGPAGVTGGRVYEQNVGQTADHLRDLADTGIDFTTVGNNIVIMPDDFCDVIGRLSDTDFPEGIKVAEDGASLATRQVVAGSDASGVVGSAGGVNPYYGLLEIYTEQTSIETQAAADSAAAARLSASAVPPVFIDTSNITLNPNSPVDFRKLVPGWCIDIISQATCRTISQRLKITGVQVSEEGGSAGSPGQERVVLQVTSTGTPLTIVDNTTGGSSGPSPETLRVG